MQDVSPSAARMIACATTFRLFFPMLSLLSQIGSITGIYQNIQFWVKYTNWLGRIRTFNRPVNSGMHYRYATSQDGMDYLITAVRPYHYAANGKSLVNPCRFGRFAVLHKCRSTGLQCRDKRQESERWDSNPRPSVWKTETLPLSYIRKYSFINSASGTRTHT